MPRARTLSLSNSLLGGEPSRVMKDILEVIRNIALSDLAVLIVGDAGTEKEWLAERIHRFSGRSEEKLVSLDCSLLGHESMAGIILGQDDLTLYGVETQKGILESASGGTLFLDNVEHLPADLLKKIAGIIEYQQFRRVGGSEDVMTRVRFVLGVCKIHDASMDERSDGKGISQRLCSVIVNLPPLKDRRDDILILIKEFIREGANADVKHPVSMSSDALRICYLYDWPGNAQELKMVIEHSSRRCTGNVIRQHDLPEYLQELSGLQFIEREKIAQH